jgi:hypothetical protein
MKWSCFFESGAIWSPAKHALKINTVEFGSKGLGYVPVRGESDIIRTVRV